MQYFYTYVTIKHENPKKLDQAQKAFEERKPLRFFTKKYPYLFDDGPILDMRLLRLEDRIIASYATRSLAVLSAYKGASIYGYKFDLWVFPDNGTGPIHNVKMVRKGLCHEEFQSDRMTGEYCDVAKDANASYNGFNEENPIIDEDDVTALKFRERNFKRQTSVERAASLLIVDRFY